VAAATRAIAKSASAYSRVVDAVPHTFDGVTVWPGESVFCSKPT
jgi:hypothetical protein